MCQPSCPLRSCQGKPGEHAKKLSSKPQKQFILSLGKIRISVTIPDDKFKGLIMTKKEFTPFDCEHCPALTISTCGKCFGALSGVLRIVVGLRLQGCR